MENNLVIFPLNETAVTIDLGNTISEELNHQALAVREWILEHPFGGLRDVIVTYSSVSIFYYPVIVKQKNNFTGTVFEFVRKYAEQACQQAQKVDLFHEGEVVRIPVCYDDDFAPDLAFIALTNHLSQEEIIGLHTGKTYYVYMIGFLPGFSYMAMVDDRLVIARKAQPVWVVPGSVGIAGSQTGIYPLNTPGGWQIIGRTPVKLFDEKSDPPVLLKAGNRVQFFRISRDEFETWNPDHENLQQSPS